MSEKQVEHLPVDPHLPVLKPLLPCGTAWGSLQAAFILLSVVSGSMWHGRQQLSVHKALLLPEETKKLGQNTTQWTKTQTPHLGCHGYSLR